MEQEDKTIEEKKPEPPIALFVIGNKTFMLAMILLIGVMSYAIYSIQSEGAICLANPGKFLATQLEESNQASVGCQCSIYKGEGGTYFFDKNNESLIPNRGSVERSVPIINFSSPND